MRSPLVCSRTIVATAYPCFGPDRKHLSTRRSRVPCNSGSGTIAISPLRRCGEGSGWPRNRSAGTRQASVGQQEYLADGAEENEESNVVPFCVERYQIEPDSIGVVIQHHPLDDLVVEKRYRGTPGASAGLLE